MSTQGNASSRHVAGPIIRQFAGVLKAEGFAVTVATPAGGLRLESERAPARTSSTSRSTRPTRPPSWGASAARAAAVR